MLFLLALLGGFIIICVIQYQNLPPREEIAPPPRLELPPLDLDKIYGQYVSLMGKLSGQDLTRFNKYQKANEIERPILLEQWNNEHIDTDTLYEAIDILEGLENKMNLPEVSDQNINKLIIKYNSKSKITDKILVYNEMVEHIESLNKKNQELYEQAKLAQVENAKNTLKEAGKLIIKTPVYAGLFLLGMSLDSHARRKKKHW